MRQIDVYKVDDKAGFNGLHWHVLFLCSPIALVAHKLSALVPSAPASANFGEPGVA